MPAWLTPLLLKYGVPLLITILQRLGLINAAEALAVKAGAWVVREVGDVKTFPEEGYPSGKNGKRDGG